MVIQTYLFLSSFYGTKWIAPLKRCYFRMQKGCPGYAICATKKEENVRDASQYLRAECATDTAAKQQNWIFQNSKHFGMLAPGPATWTQAESLEEQHLQIWCSTQRLHTGTKQDSVRWAHSIYVSCLRQSNATSPIDKFAPAIAIIAHMPAIFAGCEPEGNNSRATASAKCLNESNARRGQIMPRSRF